MESLVVYLSNTSRVRVATGRARKPCLRTRHAGSERKCSMGPKPSTCSVRACLNVCAYTPVQISCSVKMLAGCLVVLLLLLRALARPYLTRPQQLSDVRIVLMSRKEQRVEA